MSRINHSHHIESDDVVKTPQGFIEIWLILNLPTEEIFAAYLRFYQRSILEHLGEFTERIFKT
jgi:hypothetical protein